MVGFPRASSSGRDRESSCAGVLHRSPLQVSCAGILGWDVFRIFYYPAEEKQIVVSAFLSTGRDRGSLEDTVRIFYYPDAVEPGWTVQLLGAKRPGGVTSSSPARLP